MKSAKDKKDDKRAGDKTDPDNEQNGRDFTEDSWIKAGKGMLYHGRPLSDAEIEELRIHKENNEFLGISDVPEAGTGAGNVGGTIPDLNDLEGLADNLDDRHNPDGFEDDLSSGRDSNFGRNYNGGTQSQKHFIGKDSENGDKKEKGN